MENKTNMKERLKELEERRATVSQLEAEVAEQMKAELAALPEQYGFKNAEEFVAAVKRATGMGCCGVAGGECPTREASSNGAKKTKKGGTKKAAGVKVAGGKGGKKVRKARTPITDETRAAVKKLVEDGKTGAEIAKELGISAPSVQNVKKALGLVKER